MARALLPEEPDERQSRPGGLPGRSETPRLLTSLLKPERPPLPSASRTPSGQGKAEGPSGGRGWPRAPPPRVSIVLAAGHGHGHGHVCAVV